MDELAPVSQFKGTDLVPAPSALSAPRELTSLANVDQGDLVLPYLVLAQPGNFQTLADTTGATDVMPGMFVNSMNGQVARPPIRALVVHHNKSRALQPDKDKTEYDGLEMCLSRDGIVGTVYGSCATCPHAKWRENGQRNKPLCTESAVFALLTPSGPAMLRVKKSTKQNTAAVKNILSAAIFDEKELWDRYLVIGSEKQSGKTASGKDTTYYTYTLSWLRTDEVPEQLVEAAKRMHDRVDTAYQAGRLDTDEGGHEAEV